MILSNPLLLSSLGGLVSAGRPHSHSCDVKLQNGTTSSGTFRTIGHDTRTYFTGPADSEIGILFLTDIFGVDFINSQLVADSFANQGYYTLMPDLFHGNPVPVERPDTFNFTAWSTRHQPEDIDPIIETALNEIRTNTDIARLGIVGYCFGGKYVARWLGRNDTGIDAGYTAHPSGTTEAEWEGVSAPLSIANAELDTTFPLSEARQAEDILRNSTIAWQFATYSDVPHGFAIRANQSQPRQVFAKEQAFGQAVSWFGEYVLGAAEMYYGGRPAGGKKYGWKSFDEEHRAVVAE